MPLAVRRRLKRQLQDYFDVPTIERSLENMRRLGFRPSSAVDIGSYKGEWTVLARKVFPEVSCLMLEAQRGQIGELEAVKRMNPQKIDYRIVLLGPENREDAVFYEYPAPTDSSVLSILKASEARKITCRMQTLDAILAEAGMTEPDLIKIDVQGYELEVLKAAPNSLKHVQAILMEVSLVKLYESSPILHEVINFMFERNFVAYDVCSLMRQIKDNTLAQIDVIFVSKNSPLLAKKN